MPLYKGDSAELGINGFQTVYEGDGTVLWSDELTAGTRIYTASQFSSLRSYEVTSSYTAQDLNNTETIASRDSDVRDIIWNPDGTKFYETSKHAGVIYQRAASEPFSIENATFEKSEWANNPDPDGIEWATGGNKIFDIYGEEQSIVESTVDTPFDIGGLSPQVSGQLTEMTYPVGMAFNDDGTKVHVIDESDGEVFEYDMSTAFDMNTLTHNGVTYSPSMADTPRGVVWSSDGLRLWYADYGFNGFGTLNLGSNPFDLSDVVGESALSAQEVHNPSSITFNGAHPHENEYDGDAEI